MRGAAITARLDYEEVGNTSVIDTARVNIVIPQGIETHRYLCPLANFRHLYLVKTHVRPFTVEFDTQFCARSNFQHSQIKLEFTDLASTIVQVVSTKANTSIQSINGHIVSSQEDTAYTAVKANIPNGIPVDSKAWIRCNTVD